MILARTVFCSPLAILYVMCPQSIDFVFHHGQHSPEEGRICRPDLRARFAHGRYCECSWGVEEIFSFTRDGHGDRARIRLVSVNRVKELRCEVMIYPRTCHCPVSCGCERKCRSQILYICKSFSIISNLALSHQR